MLSSDVAEYSRVYDICIVYSNKKEGKDDPDLPALELPYSPYCRPEFPHGVIYSG